jgi:hypothetical protein
MKLKEFLASLGNTPDEVADWMRKNGIKGVKKNCRLCPVLNAIYSEHGVDCWSGLIISGGSKVGDSWFYSSTYDDDQIMDPSLPQPVMDFVGRFDNDVYPDLVAEKVEEKTVRVWS